LISFIISPSTYADFVLRFDADAPLPMPAAAASRVFFAAPLRAAFRSLRRRLRLSRD